MDKNIASKTVKYMPRKADKLSTVSMLLPIVRDIIEIKGKIYVCGLNHSYFFASNFNSNPYNNIKTVERLSALIGMFFTISLAMDKNSSNLVNK